MNTESGSMKISTSAGDGANGDNGQSGYNGRSGSYGAITRSPVTTTDDKGNVTTTYVETQGPGGNGEDGSAGGDGENGYSGYDGGNITVYYTRIAEQFLKMITTTSTPGSDGAQGTPGQVRYIPL